VYIPWCIDSTTNNDSRLQCSLHLILTTPHHNNVPHHIRGARCLQISRYTFLQTDKGSRNCRCSYYWAYPDPLAWTFFYSFWEGRSQSIGSLVPLAHSCVTRIDHSAHWMTLCRFPALARCQQQQAITRPNGPRLPAAVCNGGANMSRQYIHRPVLASPKSMFLPFPRVVYSPNGCAFASLAYILRHNGSSAKLWVLACWRVQVY